jgi:hypothetical protein
MGGWVGGQLMGRERVGSSRVGWCSRNRAHKGHMMFADIERDPKQMWRRAHQTFTCAYATYAPPRPDKHTDDAGSLHVESSMKLVCVCAHLSYRPA